MRVLFNQRFIFASGFLTICISQKEEDENQDDDDGVSDAASFYDEEHEQHQEGEQLSAYEQLRQSNILRNDRVLKELGFKTNLPRQVAQRGGIHGTNKVCYVRLPQFYLLMFILQHQEHLLGVFLLTGIMVIILLPIQLQEYAATLKHNKSLFKLQQILQSPQQDLFVLMQYLNN